MEQTAPYDYMRTDALEHVAIPPSELSGRLKRLQARIQENALHGALVFDPVELLYYTGSMPSGVLFVPVEGEPSLFVRRSFERARRESPLRNIHAFGSLKEIVPHLQKRSMPFSLLGIDDHATTLHYFKLLKKSFPHAMFADFGQDFRKVRAVKSAYELDKMRQAGEISQQVMAMIPELLVPGISEWELALKLFHETALRGNACHARLAQGRGECCLGTVCFGDSANHPSAFDGPDGLRGISPMHPMGGSRRILEKGDLVLVDMLFPFDEYYVDTTRVFSLGQPRPEARAAHSVCLEIQEAVRERLEPGAIPSRIYEEVMSRFVEVRGFEEHFMGFASNQVKFLGHGVGMVVNEFPVIARKSDDPLQEGMTLAVEPKKALDGLGMVGVENTFVVGPGGGASLTGNSPEIIVV